MHSYVLLKIDDVVTNIFWQISLCFQHLSISLLGGTVFSQQINFIVFSHSFEVFDVELESLEYLILKLEIQSFASKNLLIFFLVFINKCVLEVLIVKVEEIPCFLLQCISKTMESLYVLTVQIPQHGVRNHNIAQNITIFNDVNLVQSKVMVQDEYLSQFGSNRLL